MDRTVYIVHCVDTEGPLCEQVYSLDYKPFEPLGKSNFDDLPSLISAHRPRVLGCWRDIIEMLKIATSSNFREKGRDSVGNSWTYHWFCMDHVGYTDNPRQRTMGVHNIYDVYKNLIDTQDVGDTAHWHFHPMSTYREAQHCATSYINSPELWYLLCRRLIDRKSFPIANRSGFQDQRPDSHWFLEQFVPFDFSNLAVLDIDYDESPDMADGRFNDWRRAPSDWSTYHPHHDSYQTLGSCRRKIARCLNLLSRFANLDEGEVTTAFERASDGNPTLLSFSSHDWRDLALEVEYVRHVIEKVSRRFPGVEYRFADPITAFNAVHPPDVIEPLEMNWSVETFDGKPKRIDIKTVKGNVFGPQPFIAIKTKSRRYIHDNLNLGSEPGTYNYQFDKESILPDDVEAVGIAANDSAGNQFLETRSFGSAAK